MNGVSRFVRKPLPLAVIAALCSSPAFAAPPGHVTKHGVDLDIRSMGRQIADDVAQLGNTLLLEAVSPVLDTFDVPQIQLRGTNVQVNDGALDNIQEFTGFRAFIKYTQSETSIAAFGRNIVATYNNSADQPIISATPPSTVVFQHRFLSGFSTSNDGGKTWTSGSMPPMPGSIFTFGDPSVGVDRKGTFYLRVSAPTQQASRPSR